MINSLYRYAFRSNPKVIFHNQDDQKLFEKLELIEPQNTMVVKGSGVNTNFFRPLKSQHKNGKFIFLFVGRLLYDKGIVEFIQAAKQVKQIIKNAECWVVGELSTKNPSKIPKKKLLQWVENRYIRYWGATNDIRSILKEADVLVLPSYREGMPRAVLEAMSMAKPIITTDTAGCRETVDHKKNGYLVPVRDSLSLAEAMVNIYSLDIDQLEKMGEASRVKVLDQFDEKIINQQYVDLVELIFNGKKNIPTASTSKKIL